MRAGELLLASGTPAEPLELARRAVAAQPNSEPAHQLLVSAYLAAGNRTAARHALDDCHHMLHALGAPPDARTRMLTRQLGGTTQTSSASQVTAHRASGMPGHVSPGRMR
ncbi:MAG: bacterial transcriptional activator domain-containing protein [Frankiaceae bacterium]